MLPSLRSTMVKLSLHVSTSLTTSKIWNLPAGKDCKSLITFPMFDSCSVTNRNVDWLSAVQTSQSSREVGSIISQLELDHYIVNNNQLQRYVKQMSKVHVPRGLGTRTKHTTLRHVFGVISNSAGSQRRCRCSHGSQTTAWQPLINAGSSISLINIQVAACV
jgi:hypothetical protein